VFHLCGSPWLHGQEELMDSLMKMQELRHLLEQCHPIPLSFEHKLNYCKHFMTILQPILQKPLEARLKEGTCESAVNFQGFFLMVLTADGRSPTWEYDSFHPRLKLSDDHLVVKFSKLWQVLSRDAFLSGSHYWEYDLLHEDGAGWWIGTAYPSIASWCLKKFNYEYWAFHKGERIPILIEYDPDCIGIFLDYKARILSFYSVTDGMAHLHTFCCKFTELVYPALKLWEGSIGICKLT
uniref:Tripartite motif containing 14 n=1 Tax=Athene cunicularia TaxID=194338 RepID=A0A663NEQ8_ATHCN